jgi:hypothetical protein
MSNVDQHAESLSLSHDRCAEVAQAGRVSLSAAISQLIAEEPDQAEGAEAQSVERPQEANLALKWAPPFKVQEESDLAFRLHTLDVGITSDDECFAVGLFYLLVELVDSAQCCQRPTWLIGTVKHQAVVAAHHQELQIDPSLAQLGEVNATQDLTFTADSAPHDINHEVVVPVDDDAPVVEGEHVLITGGSRVHLGSPP